MGERFYYEVMNGKQPQWEWYSYCDRCGKYIHESYPQYNDGDILMCGDCAFLEGLISEEEYIKNFLFFISVKRAAVHEGKIYTLDSHKKKFPWEQTNSEQRKDPSYADWRTKVYERDDYTCKMCGQVGGKLNAHHIKPFKQFPEFRLDVSNGVTLCEKCHRKVHREKCPNWIYVKE